MSLNPFNYLPWNSWGGTKHLEDRREAVKKYKERLNGWSDTTTWGRWMDGDRITALNDAESLYFQSENAAEYWRKVANLWAGYADSMTSIHPDQFAKIVGAVGASSDAADTYLENRNWKKWIGELPPKPKDVPWWVWAVGGLVVWNSIRR